MAFSLIIYSDMAYANQAATQAPAPTAMPLVENLQTLGKQALQDNLPIAILFAAEGLKSTENLKDQAIIPALMSGQLNNYVLMAEIHVNTDRTITDFYGEAMPVAEFKDLYNLTSLPVMIFVDGNGDQIIQPLLSGAYDFYYHYLKLSINDALKALGNNKRIPI
ncbi:hypothetical protein [Thiomicrorhabdus sediminis]|uniref:Uncharacterized protein n=1 Tax=Thiomicrorhabdus sediminis TaxID=2580412 RepID=A0A4P9K604_9GAMM|nr:hypothetical protein [Thiomicrorhabdus sediminis]QCU89716.1 hypothetical protein FE785_03205 [Thiomicrorhabdus sediminis]